jgi:anthranilate synthase component 2
LQNCRFRRDGPGGTDDYDAEAKARLVWRDDANQGISTFMLLMIDNYDSFTYNLVQYLGELGQDVRVYRNDQITVAGIAELTPDHIVISPGPCTPNEAGISLAAIRSFAGKIPILGVCLGHQSIGQAFGGKIVHARAVMHGKTSMIYHHDTGVFRGLENPFEATRYHSLVIDKETLPECLEITAWTRDGIGHVDEIMGVRHKELSVEGVQFHPESILTQHGHQMLQNFLEMK